MAEYRLSPQAVRDIEGFWAYSYQNWGADQADIYTDALMARFAAISQVPRTAPSLSHLRKGYRYARAEKHVFFFETHHYGIAIIRILHERIDPSRHLR